jgi:3-methyladenine DNA glycosylase/8-oxoguanine DNA glycosylase
MVQAGPCTIAPRPAPQRFDTLTRAIVGQMVSGASARAVTGRLHLAAGKPLQPQAILDLGPEGVRGCGLSGAKTASILDLASRVADGRLELARIGRLSDDAIIERLTAVRGIGVWTAHMFLIFALARPDVLAPGDLGIRAGLKHHFSLPDLPAPRECAALTESWRPYRSVGLWYLWRLVEMHQAAARRSTSEKPGASR